MTALQIAFCPAGPEPERCRRLAVLHAASFSAGWSPKDFAGLLEVTGTWALIAHSQAADMGLLLYRQLVDEVEILTLGVVPEARKQGVASRLMHAMLADFPPGIRQIFLEVAADNEPAIALYHRHGFQKIAERKAYYRRPGQMQDAWVMRLSVES